MEIDNGLIQKTQKMKEEFLRKAKEVEGEKREYYLMMAKNCEKQIERLTKIYVPEETEERDL